MKTADIEIGGFYAVGSKFSANNFNLRRGEVLEVKVAREVWGRGSYRYETRHDGVRVRVDAPGEAPLEVVYPSREIHQKWSDYAVARDERNARIQRKQDADRIATLNRQEEVAAIKEKFFAFVGREPEYRLKTSLESYARFGGTVEISLSDLNALLVEA